MYQVPSSTLFLGKNLLILPECPSTNTFAVELSQSGQAPEGTVVITHHQTAGRGQRGNTWQSAKGLNLTLSVVLNPVFLVATQQFLLNKAIALAVRETIQPYVEEPVRVKWPNDILIGDKKVCGILIENQLVGEKISRSVAGIGINVNQQGFDSPTASSVMLHAGKEIDIAKMFEDLLKAIEIRYLEIKNKKTEARNHDLDSDYIRNLYRINESHRYIVGDNEVEGVIRDIDVHGRLIVEIDHNLRSFDLKEIKYVY